MDNDDTITELSVQKEAEINAIAALQDTVYNLALRDVDPVNVNVTNLSLDVNTAPPLWETSPSQLLRRLRGQQRSEDMRKTVLNGVHAAMPSGSLTAIIGSSGSGKTSLLNLMAGRM